MSTYTFFDFCKKFKIPSSTIEELAIEAISRTTLKKLVYIVLLSLTAFTTTIGERQSLDDEDDEGVNESEIVEARDHSSYYWLTVSSLIALQATTLLLLGQPIIGRTSEIKLWFGDVYSRGNSQHLMDWYTFTHILHGVVYYWLTGLVLPRASMPSCFLLAVLAEVAWEVMENSPVVNDGVVYYWLTGLVLPRASMPSCFLLAVLAEVAWEVMENSPVVIDRYRRTALANGYSGDSVINSVSDTIAMTAGFYLSKVLPAGVTTVIVISTELICAFAIVTTLH